MTIFQYFAGELHLRSIEVKMNFVLFERTLWMIKEHLLQFFRILILGCEIKVCLIRTLAYVIHCIMIVVKVEISLKLSNKVTRNCACRDICLMTPNNESFDWFNRIISIICMIHQQPITQCDVCSVIYISNKSQYLKNEGRYGKTIDGVPLSFQEFFQIRQT